MGTSRPRHEDAVRPYAFSFGRFFTIEAAVPGRNGGGIASIRESSFILHTTSV